MRGYFRWAPEKVEKLREMKHAGETNANIAIHFSTTRQSVEGACNKHGIKIRKSVKVESRSNSATLRKQAEALLKVLRRWKSTKVLISISAGSLTS